MSKDWYQDIVDLHKQWGQPIGEKPKNVDAETALLRIALIQEETQETILAILNKDLPKIADGIGDSIVVLLGTAVVFGLDMRPIWNEIQRTNLQKTGNEVRGDGKVLKPAGWQPPDIERLLEEQGRE